MPEAELLTRLKRDIIAGTGGGLLTQLMKTTRSELISGIEVERSRMIPRLPTIYVLWHGRLLPCAYRYRTFQLGTLISRNRDGDYITRMIERWGYRVVRGSSSRGGSAALRSIIRFLREGTSVALTPDGPRGPRQQMKLGPLQAARMTGLPIVPVTAGAVGAWYFGNWDRFLVPKPFTWIPVAFGEPVYIDANASEATLQECATDLGKRLDEMTKQVDQAAADARRH